MPKVNSIQSSSFGDRRREIIAATIAVIERDGLEGATARRIAQELGATIGTIWHYFADKDELLKDVVRACFAPWFGALEIAKGTQSAWDQLQSLFISTLPAYRAEQSQAWLALLHKIKRDDHLFALYREGYGELRRVASSLIATCQLEGVVRPDLDPFIESSRLFALADGLVFSAMGEPERFPDEVLSQIMSSQLEMLRA